MIYVTGANGQLGAEFRKRLDGQAVFLTRKELDFNKLEEVRTFLESTKITTLINTAAYTKVDLAESHSDEAHLINSSIPALMAEYSDKKKFKFVHFSTDYVFNGKNNSPYQETDQTNPLNVYGKSKEEGERKVRGFSSNSLIFRTSWVYSDTGSNFIKTMLKVGAERDEVNVVYDQIGTLTSANDLAEVTLKALEQGLEGIFHYSSEGVTSWYDIAVYLKKKTGFKAKVRPILSTQYPTPANRPKYGLLDKQKIKSALDFDNYYWSDSLDSVLKTLIQ